MTRVDTHEFTVRFWGVRGSIPTPGPETARYGGNTTCIEVRVAGELIIIDCGSGLRPFGTQLERLSAPIRATFLVSHMHLDHLLGFPFFGPAFAHANTFSFFSEPRVFKGLRAVLSEQMTDPTFPIGIDAMGAQFRFHEIVSGDSFRIGPVTVRTAPLNHPGGATAFRIEYDGLVYVHASDHEHKDALHAPLLELARGADFLSLDATYTDAEYSGELGQSHVGWGHSTWQEACKLSRAAGVKRLVLFHHDPSHTDALLDGVAVEAAAHLDGTVVAREGMVLDVRTGAVQPG
jgi:phosphoribosyl 1,2-cyclic phosphodiesterase